MSGPPELATTTRTTHFAGVDDIAPAIRELKEMAAGRAGEIDVMILYSDDSILDTGKDVERHREPSAASRRSVPPGCHSPGLLDQAQTLDFVEDFGATYLGATGSESDLQQTSDRRPGNELHCVSTQVADEVRDCHALIEPHVPSIFLNVSRYCPRR